MKVKELIDILSGYSGDMEVCIGDKGTYNRDAIKIAEVETYRVSNWDNPNDDECEEYLVIVESHPFGYVEYPEDDWDD